MADSCLGTKLEHLLTRYFLLGLIGNNHEIRKMNVMVGFNDQKITLIHDLILYYHFLQGETITKALVEEPTNWVIEDFKDWREQGVIQLLLLIMYH